MPRRKKRRSRTHPDSLPKGAYRVPSGGYATERTGKPNASGQRITIRAIRRQQPNIRLLADLLMQRAEDHDAER